MLYGFKVSTRYLRNNSSYKNKWCSDTFGDYWGQKIYFLIELFKYPILVITYIIKRKPYWSGVLQKVKR
jgi:hypothetical protein